MWVPDWRTRLRWPCAGGCKRPGAQGHCLGRGWALPRLTVGESTSGHVLVGLLLFVYPCTLWGLGVQTPASREEGTGLGVVGKSQDSPPETLLSGRTGAEAGRRGQGSGDM